MNKVPERKLDSYEVVTNCYSKLVDEVREIEHNSQWHSGVTARELHIEPIEGPIFAAQLASRFGIDEELLHDTAAGGTKLMLQYGRDTWCIRDTARLTLYETAKLFGSALGRMDQCRLADTLNNGFFVARGNSLLLERYGKISALHSDAKEGYGIMPISTLLDIADRQIQTRFGMPDFIQGINRHDYTYALWELPVAQSELIDVYQQALTAAVSSKYAINFMPAISFSSSDTASSSAIMRPLFKLPSGTYFRVGEGVKVRHKRAMPDSTQKAGIDLFEELTGDLFAKFTEAAETLEKMAKTEIWHPVNCLIGICNKLKIPRKYADIAREDFEQFMVGLPCCSMHDLYLSLAECIGYAQRMDASRVVLLDMEEKIAKILHMEWSEYDVGGVVAWGA